ncbi:DUF58 domain-containing protein [Rubricoccus marinus]|uniref:DUF58 domain-containing protein n=1 Tax=Rubricoccus marinus TaxID=716817 RepID=A0A259U038_9BACT|nr:DUF58 domain-containing protein [Rubricoccus marinus]OZC03198.1 hypothetical protein BSZ36_09560 [Rubricoccus marinus]
MPVSPAPSDRLTPEALARIGSLELRARLIVEGFITGMHRSPYHGFSVEFAQHRPYNRGDELRHVDWKVWARKDRWMVKQYEEETNLRHAVVLDTSPSMRYAGASGVSKLAYGATLGAALHTLMVRQRDATGLAAFDSTLHTLVPPRAARAHLRALLATLDRLESAPATPPAPEAETGASGVARALDEVAERLPKRSLVTIISDLFETMDGAAEIAKALRHLRHRGHEVLVFHVLDAKTERDFAFDDLPVRMRDMETGETLTLQPAQLREHYREASGAFFNDFKRRCREIEADYVLLDTAQPYDHALSAYLQKRKRLF